MKLSLGLPAADKPIAQGPQRGPLDPPCLLVSGKGRPNVRMKEKEEKWTVRTKHYIHICSLVGAPILTVLHGLAVDPDSEALHFVLQSRS
jgi:hypothetical protein